MRWYEVYIFLTGSTFILSLIISFFSGYGAFVLGFGIMAMFSFAAFTSHVLIDGFTARTGGFFWTMITCVTVCYFGG